MKNIKLNAGCDFVLIFTNEWENWFYRTEFAYLPSKVLGKLEMLEKRGSMKQWKQNTAM